MGHVINPLCDELQSLYNLLLPVITFLPALFPFQNSDDKERNVVIEVDEGVGLRGDQQSQESKRWSLGDILDEEMLDVVENFVLSEDRNGAWVSSSSHLQIFVDFIELSHFDFVL
jgi:hypothetical protein